MDETFRQLIVSMNMGAISFDADLQMIEFCYMPEGVQSVLGRFRPKTSLSRLFPEFVGSEDALRQILADSRSDFRMDNVNREDDSGRLTYWDLLVLPDADTGKGLLLIRDVTSRARMLQELNQRRYDALLYEGRLKQRDMVSDHRLLGKSPAMETLRGTIDKLGRVPSATVLLQGETGTGKSHVARVIHLRSCSPGAPFVDVNCAALPENLIEAELFGSEKGAFTHATQTRKGLLEEAEGGTLFLDEIGELPFGLQAKLLTVIESKKLRRLGSNARIVFRARIIAATNRNLAEEIQARRFRQDLFFRLNVAPLTLPPLRELRGDILLLAEHFIHIFNVEFKKRVTGLTREAEKSLMSHPWPGNVRELSNCIERAMIFAEDGPIGSAELMLMPPAQNADLSTQWQLPPAGVALEEVERRLIQSALEQTRGNKTRAAALLGLTRDTLRYRLEKFGID
ncbi:MAG: sigma-54-dependent Fis family transcriptional regulator [Desulfobacterales bacterium]|nr:sigma-54-dependent Fis family transcriptional regulator [Desulfobacterales bacterium]